MIWDVFTYNGERDVLRIHLNILAPFVDRFIICESKVTFSGNKKPLYFFRDQRYFEEFWPKIQYFVIGNEYTADEIALAESSPNTQGAQHWCTEFLQKESIHKALKESKVQDDDIVFIGDVDEIVDPTTHFESEGPTKANLRVYSYYLNNKSTESFHGTLMAKYGDIKNECLNHVRSDTSLYSKANPIGWHFTSMGGLEEVKRKLNDSYTKESYNTDEVQRLLPYRIAQRTDYLGREFTFTLDESDWPQYLKEHKKDYKHLIWRP